MNIINEMLMSYNCFINLTQMVKKNQKSANLKLETVLENRKLRKSIY